ncbi:PAX3- and PAX7-binding protein 1-like [Mercenaria mercenaria]|uniref:PAX3- and PAX7-binding protein 1-like n=1 Tax=Mercenaria mercenaria TaxID=6596 RepID=UPI001E1D7757|nr:PAX3- and PAX7-binding protein 1-like [Mercenaria mercenaria]
MNRAHLSKLHVAPSFWKQSATMFKKPKRKFRQRLVKFESDDENEEEMDTEGTPPRVQVKQELNKSIKEKKKKEKSKAVLSFDHDEGDTTFQVKKSTHSKKVAKLLKKESQLEKQTEAGDKEDKTANKIDGDLANIKEEAKDQQDMEDRIKKLREDFLTMNGDDAAALEEADSDEEGTFKKMLKRGEIPDATTIHQIRKQRQMARDMGDFLPLDDTVKFENTKSRLVREDDNDKSDDEDERIDFSSNQHAIERQKVKENFLRAEHGSDEGSDQEREWEDQQIQKGVSVIQQVPSSQDLYSYDQDSQPADGMYSNGYPGTSGSHGYQGNMIPVAEGGFPDMPKMMMKSTEDVTLEGLIKRLKDRLTSMDEVHRSHKQESDKLEHDIEESQMSIVNCEASAPKLEDRFRFFQEMRGYVRDLVECLNEKVPEINELETRMNNLLRNRSSKFASRRQQDIQDQCQSYMTNKSQVVVDVDNQARQRRIAEREARRARRRRAREGKNIMGHHEGLSSDDEENQSEITKYSQERDEIVNRASELFEDVMDDFSDTDCVREKFMSWKHKYGDTYREAYIGLCLPKLVNPFVRLQLISWNPFDERCKDFEEMRWFDSLLFYGFEEGETIDKDEDDNKLIPAIIDKVVLPKLSYLAENVWDPLSTSHTCRFVKLVKKLLKDYPTVNANSKNTQTLLKSLVLRMKKTLDDDVFMPLYPKSVLENRNAGPSVFFHRQSWTCIKLLGHFLSWDGIISRKVLQGLALDGLLNRYILLGLQTAPFNQETLLKCQTIVSTLPKQWFEDLNEDKTIMQLESLCRFLMYAAQLLDKACGTASDLQRKELKEQLKQISKLLINIHALEHAMKLSELYSLTAK